MSLELSASASAAPTTTTKKEELIEKVKEWVRLDSELSRLRKMTREITQKKKGLTVSLVDVMKQHTIDCFDIHGGSLVYKKTKVKKPINAKMLLQVLQKYCEGNEQHKGKAEELVGFILENREEAVKETILMKSS
jgi:Family of unknown function (DUF5760)